MIYAKQAVWILLFTFIGELLNALLPLPVPAGVYGLLLLLGALCTGLIRLEAIEKTGNFLLDIMTMLFIPAAVGIMSVVDLLLPVLMPYLVITIASTLLVMLVTGKVSQTILEHRGRGTDREEAKK